MVVKDALDVLESKNCRHEDKTQAYDSLFRHLLSEEVSLYEEELRRYGATLLRILFSDIVADDGQVVFSALRVFHYCVKDDQVGSKMSKAEAGLALQALLQCTSKIKSLDAIKLVLDCLAVQKFHPEILTLKIFSILECLEDLNNQAKQQSTCVLDRMVDVFFRLSQQIETNLRSSAPSWARLIFQGLTHPTKTVREKTLAVLEKYQDDLRVANDWNKFVIKAINVGQADSLKNLVQIDELFVLKAWTFIVTVVGKELHKGATINLMLEIIEISFKGSQLARHNAFLAWKSLIDNFALDKNVISSPKRIKLLLMVLKLDNAKSEPVAMEKLHTWWHLVINLGPMLYANSEQIVYPLLRFCVGSESLLSGSSNHRRILAGTPVASPSSSKGHLPVFPGSQKLGCEVIAHLVSSVSKTEDPGKIAWNLAPLTEDVFATSTIFVKHAPLVLMALESLLTSVGNQLEESLVLHIWISLANRLKKALDSPVKTECREVYSSYLGILHSVVQSGIFRGDLAMKMIQTCCSFSQKVLVSTAYNIMGGQTVRACPAQLLCEVLLSPSVVENASTNENYLKLYSMLVNAGASSRQGALLFLQTVTEILDSRASALPSVELLWRLWSTLAHTLQDNINTTNEVNQGDALEYNFNCLYIILLLPIKHQLAGQVSQVVSKAVSKTWKELYSTFARLSALVTTAEANVCLEELCAKIVQCWKPEFGNPVSLEFLSSACQRMIECVDFSALSVNQTTGGGLTLSPSKWVRRRQKPLGNLHSFVHLLATLHTETKQILSQTEAGNGQKENGWSVSVIFIAHTLVEIDTKLFVHITTNNMISNCLSVLASPMAVFYQSHSKSGPVKLFVPSFLTKLEKLWQEIVHCVTGRYSGPYDSELLENIAPLLDATFLHSRRAIKNQTHSMWNTTFGRMPTLTYPNSLKPTLSKMKEKNAIILPGWITSEEVAVIAETPFSEMSMGDSQAPAPVLPGMPSPKRQRGSMLNRDSSPTSKVSPKAVTSPAKDISKEFRSVFSWVRKNIALEFMPQKEFVVIESPATKKKRLLTEHQKEVLKQKSALPAMYNNLDASQDICLMSHFGTDTQNNSISSADVIIVNSSGSQERDTAQPQGKTKSAVESGSNNSTSAESFAAPRSQTAPRRRRSVRIQEMSSNSGDDIESVHVSELTDSNRASQIEKHTNSNENKNTEESKQVDGSESQALTEKDNSEENIVKSSVESNLLTYESQNEQQGKTKSDAEKTKDFESPFLMFRSKSTSSEGLTKGEISGSQEYSSPSSALRPRRVSVRKVRSQDDGPSKDASSRVSMLQSFDNSVSETKSPRRVPLRKISEQKNEMATKTDHSKPEEQTLSTNLQKWLSKSKQSDKPSLAPQKTASEHVTAPCTLVEDTQSPLKKAAPHKELVHSIAETPTKGEDSHSPPLRSSSARKLFVDGKEDITKCQDIDSSRAETDEVNVDANGHPERTEDSVVASQGFDVSQNIADEPDSDKHSMFGLSQLTDEKDDCEAASGGSREEKEITQRDVAYPESEVLFPGSGQEDDNFSLEMMPTLASPVTVAEKSKSSSSENSKTLSSDSSAKSTISSESDFNPSQPTLMEDSADVLNKRKKNTPKKYSPVKHRRRSRGANAFRKCPCCKGSTMSNHKEEKCTGKYKDRKEKTSSAPLSVNANKAVETVSSERVSASHENAKTALEQNDGDINTRSKDVVFSNLGSEELPPKIGESTPDVKSSDHTPQRRHSAVKRKGRSSQRAIKQAVTKSVTSTENETGESVELEMSQESAQSKSVQSPHCTRSRYSRSGHLLRTRNKCGRKSSPNDNQLPPKKLRKLNPAIAKKHEDSKSAKVNGETKDKGECSDTEKVQQSSNVTTMAAVKGKQRQEVTKQAAVTDIKIREDNSRIIDAVLSSALSELISASHSCDNAGQQTMEVVPSRLAEVANVEPMSEDSTGLSPAGVIEESQDHLQPGQKNSDVADGETESTQPETQISVSENGTGVQTSLNFPPDSNSNSKENETAIPEATEKQVSTVSEESMEDSSIDTGYGHKTASVDMAKEVAAVWDTVLKSQADWNAATHADDLNIDGGNRIFEDNGTSMNKFLTEGNASGEREEKDGQTQGDVEMGNETTEAGTPPTQITEPVEPEANLGKETGESVVHDWSPGRPPSVSILKRPATETPPSAKNLRVSFAEPVVSGESPVRETCPGLQVPSSPRMSPTVSSPGRRASLFTKSLGRVSGYRRRLESSLRKEPSWSRSQRNSPTSSPPSSYKATQQSQLNSKDPIFPDLVDCSNPLGDILPQLTSSLWYRGLCQLMKGRNLNTIGDLSSLTEVQVDQLPIRHPKVLTVKSTLTNYMMQHGLSKPDTEDDETLRTPKSKGATLEKEVTPSSIADEGVEVLPGDEVLQLLSPIKDSQGTANVSGGSRNGHCSCKDAQDSDKQLSNMLASLQEIADRSKASGLKDVNTAELFDIHQTLNSLFSNVVEEMKARQPNG